MKNATLEKNLGVTKGSFGSIYCAASSESSKSLQNQNPWFEGKWLAKVERFRFITTTQIYFSQRF
jgi:hypothetical protein